MANKFDVNFEIDILDIDRENIKEKIIPYLNELIEALINNKCENVKINTKIRKLTSKEVGVYITLKDIL